MRRNGITVAGFLMAAIISGHHLYAQTTPEKLAAIDDEGKWRKAEASIRKALAKDSLNPEPPFLLAHFYFSATHKTFHVDSADYYHRLSAKLNGRGIPSKK